MRQSHGSDLSAQTGKTWPGQWQEITAEIAWRRDEICAGLTAEDQDLRVLELPRNANVPPQGPKTIPNHCQIADDETCSTLMICGERSHIFEALLVALDIMIRLKYERETFQHECSKWVNLEQDST